MPSDRDRFSYDKKQQYRSVVSQQGRVLLPADFNEAQEIGGEQLRYDALDIVGPAGTPDDGYKIGFPAGPPDFNFSIGAGAMYVGGMRLKLFDPVTYFDQPDWLDPTPLTGAPQREYVFLDIEEQEVSAVEDGALRDVALGGPDTTQRTRLIQRVVRQPVSGATCAQALAEQAKRWNTDGLTFNPKTMRLESTAGLKVGFTQTLTLPNPCEPSSQGGYLGSENQLIRVRLTAPNRLVWGFDDASFLYRADVVNTGDNRTLKLQTAPVDSFHRPVTGQAVEILRAQAVLSNGEFVAAGTGRIDTLGEDYNPDSQSIRLPAALTPAFLVPSGTKRLFVRVWQQELTFTPGTPVTLGSTGVTVTLQAGTNPFHTGDFWAFAVRPNTPVKVYPERYLADFQPAEGPRRWACPLYVIGWSQTTGSVIVDCRRPFAPLTELIDPGIRITKVATAAATGVGGADLVNDTDVTVARVVAGIEVTCDGPVSPPMISRPTCYATIETPTAALSNTSTAPPQAYQQLTLAANVGANGNVISWRPTQPAANFLQQLPAAPAGDRGYLMRLILEGNYITSTNPDLYLDGDAFGVRAPNAPNTSLRLPTGDRRRGGRFQTWFWLTPAVRTPLTFTASALPVTLRAEGLTELVGDIVIVGTGGTPTAAGQAVPLMNLTVLTNAPITSARLSGENIVDAVLLIDDPAKLNLGALTGPPTGVNGVDGGLDYAGGGAPNILLGRKLAANNSVTFIGIPIDPPGTGRTRTLRIKNVRIAATALPGGLAPAQALAMITLQNPPPETVLTNPQVTVGFVAAGQSAQVRRTDGAALPLSVKASEILNRDLANSIPTLNASTQFLAEFSEGFPTAFKVRGDGAEIADVPGREEAAYQSATPPLTPGAATQGTRFLARFVGVPAGVRIFVTTRDVPATAVSPNDPNIPPMTAVLLTLSADGSTFNPPPTKVPLGNGSKTGNIPVAEVNITSGAGVAVWEWVNDTPGAPQSIQQVRFGVLVATTPLPANVPATMSVDLSFAPLSQVADSAPLSTPVPRFVDTTQAINFLVRQAG